MLGGGHVTTYATPVRALDGRDSLGFLAGLGLLRTLGEPYRLAWDPSTGLAVIHGPARDLEELVDLTVERVGAMADDELSLGLPDRLVPAKIGSAGADPARIDLDGLRELVDGERSPGALEWMAVLWTDLADDNDGRCARTPFNAPAGQQTLRSMFANPRSFVTDDAQRWIREAMCGWSRVPGHTGEGLESRALRDASELVEAKYLAYGVPGATFLALAALPFFRVSGNGVLAKGVAKDRWRSQRTATCWHRVPDGRRTKVVFAWPLWGAPLDQHAISAVLEHPVIARALLARLRSDEQPSLSQVESQLDALGVWAIPVASRRQAAGGKSEGFLTVERIERF
jgi:hypothetical protein